MNIRQLIQIINQPENIQILQNHNIQITIDDTNMYLFEININNNQRIFNLNIVEGSIRINNMSLDRDWINLFTRRSATSSHGICLNDIAHRGGLLNSIIRYNQNGIDTMTFMIALIQNVNDPTLISGRRVGVRGG